MADAKVSIIVPVYKTEKYLEKCISSIVAQTYTDLEIILVDDGSPDQCPQLCDAWAAKDSRIRVIHKENGGLCSARNAGMEIMTGEYFMFADSDDWLEPDMIAALYTMITKHQADVARCSFYFNYEADGSQEAACCAERIDVCTDYNAQLSDLVITGIMSGTVWNKLYKTETLGAVRFDKADGCSEDIMFNWRALRCKIKMVCFGEAKYHYLLRENSCTHSEFDDSAFAIITAKRKIMAVEAENQQAMPSLIQGYIISCYAILSGIIQNQKCLDQHAVLRREILSHKKEIFFSARYSFRDKMKTAVLWLAPKLFDQMIKRKG